MRPGEWRSPLSAAIVAQAGVSVSWPQIVGDDVWWVETRPTEAGRRVIVSQKRGDLIAAPFSASHTVHEMSGRSYLGIEVGDSYRIYFSNRKDQRVYLKKGESAPIPLTPDTNGADRYAEFIKVPNGIWCVREQVNGATCKRQLIEILDDGNIRTLIAGHQFFAHPRISPDGKYLSWISWDHPFMPWDGTRLFVADIKEGQLSNKRALAGSDTNPVLSPEWLDSETLVYIDEESGWWNPWKVDVSGRREQIIKEDTEWGFPAWQLGYQGVAILKDRSFIAIHGPVEKRQMVIVDVDRKTLKEVVSNYSYFASTFFSDGNRTVSIASSHDTFPTIVEIDSQSASIKGVIRPNPLPIPKEYAAPISEIRIPTPNYEIKVILHRAHNPEHKVEGPTPLLVLIHGGPTGNKFATADIDYLYWTTRGFTIADVNHAGSTGYGAKYRHLLYGNWGIIDYQDVLATVKYLIEIGVADPSKVFISGGSAGGFTVLNSLIHSNLFAAGADYYGVAELTALATDTHDFESRYLDSMIGPYPEKADLYKERSPLTHAEKLSTPIIIFQGTEDPIVPPSQSEKFRDVCVKKGITHKYFAFEGESHGFVRADSLITSLEENLKFFGAAGGFNPVA
jgi:dipeptidyl aminopeptidase/acylaminoacyl peptidase